MGSGYAAAGSGTGDEVNAGERERRGRGKGKAARWRANVFTDLWHEGWQKAVTEDVTGEKL